MGIFPNNKWDPYRDGISQSALSLFRSCKEQFRLAYVEGWASNNTSLPLEYGSCFHWILSEIYGLSHAPSPEERDHFLDRYKELWNREHPIVSSKQTEMQELVYAVVEVVLDVYTRVFEGDWTGKYRGIDVTTVTPVKWVGLEKEFLVPIKFSANYSAIPIKGIFDGVFEDKYGSIWLFETKTKSYIDEEFISDTLHLNLQTMLYLTALEKIYDKTPAGVLYNVCRRPGQRLLKEDTLTDYVGRVRKDVSNAKRYEHYFKRYEMRLTKGELADWKRKTLRPLLKEVAMWWDGKVPHYLNDDALSTKYGRADLYDLIVHGDTRNYIEKKDRSTIGLEEM